MNEADITAAIDDFDRQRAALTAKLNDAQQRRRQHAAEAVAAGGPTKPWSAAFDDENRLAALLADSDAVEASLRAQLADAQAQARRAERDAYERAFDARMKVVLAERRIAIPHEALALSDFRHDVAISYEWLKGVGRVDKIDKRLPSRIGPTASPECPGSMR